MTTATRTEAGTRDRDATIAAVVILLTTAWNRLHLAQLEFLRTLDLHRADPAVGASARLRAATHTFLTSVAAFDRDARAATERWVAVDLPVFYRDGALTALEKTVHSVQRKAAVFAWSAQHQAAITTISAQYYADLVNRITEAVRRAQAFTRDAQAQARMVQGVDRTKLLDAHPLDTVIYRNQARHPITSWATGALGVQATAARNAAALNYGQWDLEAQWFEITDGPECGWAGHDDADHADGTIRSADDANEWPTSHFGCIRQLIPRPDLNDGTDLASGDQAS